MHMLRLYVVYVEADSLASCPLAYIYLQGSAKRLVPSVASHFCLSLPAAFMQPGQSILADLGFYDARAISRLD